jgi:hypothetical protein
MRRGCVAIGEIKCNNCKRLIEHGERYLLMAGDNDTEESKQRICVDCCLKEKYAAYIKEKGEQILSFFADEHRS